MGKSADTGLSGYCESAAGHDWAGAGDYLVTNLNAREDARVVHCADESALADAMAGACAGDPLPRVCAETFRTYVDKECIAGLAVSLRVLSDALGKAGAEPPVPQGEWWSAPYRAVTELYLEAESCGALESCDAGLLDAAMGMCDALLRREGDLAFGSDRALRARLVQGFCRADSETVALPEAADALGVTRARISQMLAEGTLHGIKVRGRVRIFRRSLDGACKR